MIIKVIDYPTICMVLRLQLEAAADGVGPERAGEADGQRLLRLPAGAMRGYHDGRFLGGQRGHGLGDDVAVAEVETAEDGVEVVDPRDPFGVPDDVDDAGVAAPGEHHESLVPDMQDDCLVVVYGLVGVPAAVLPLLVRGRHTDVEVGGPIDLAGDQQLAVEQE